MRAKKHLNSRWITVLLLFVGAVFLAVGIWRNENTIVMQKAINICLECIGIG